MTTPLTPEAIELLLAGYALNDLDETEINQVEHLLTEHPELMAEVNRLRDTFNQVVCGLNETEPPPQLQAAILQAVDPALAGSSVPPLASPSTPLVALPAPSASARLAPARKRRSLPWTKVLGSVAALVIVYLGVENYQLRQDLSVARDVSALLQDSETHLFALKSMNNTQAEQASGSFVVNLEQQKGVLEVSNLPALPAGSVYRLWAIVDGEKIPCGQFKTDRQGTVLEKFSMPADFYEAGISGLLITVEPSQLTRYPTSPAVMKSVED